MAISSGRIDVHCHSVTPAWRQFLLALGDRLSMRVRAPEWSAELMLAYMDRCGTHTSIVSLSTPGVHIGDDAAARQTARKCNEEFVELVSRDPARFGAFATVPLPDVEGACREARHALEVMQLDGIGVYASYGQNYLGQPAFDPLFEYLNERAAVVHIHPTLHPSTKDIKTGMNPGVLPPLAEFLFDTTRAAMNLLFSDYLDRFPNIKFILSHGGGTLPYAAWRIAEIATRQMGNPPWSEEYPSAFMQRHAGKVTVELVLSYFKRFWYDMALSTGRQTFGALKEVAAPDRLLFGSDWPYCPESMSVDTIAALHTQNGLSPQQIGAIERGNTLALFARFA